MLPRPCRTQPPAVIVHRISLVYPGRLVGVQVDVTATARTPPERLMVPFPGIQMREVDECNGMVSA